MFIENLKNDIPDNVRDLLLSYVPFGSEYCLFVSSADTYDLLYKTLGSSVLNHIQLSNDVVTVLNDNLSYDGFTVDYPLYCYSNHQGQGIRPILSSNYDLITLMMVVVCCLAILKIVFGGIRIWSDRRK